jgi:hypothetical protein
MDPARAKIEVTLTQLRGVGNDRTNAKSAPDKTLEHRRCASIVVDLLDPAFHEADAEAVLESFDRQHFQVGENAVLITPCVIYSGCSIKGRIRSQPFDRDVEPLRDFAAILEHTNFDGRTLSQ